MGSCTRRHFLLSICFLQLMTIIERQVFDFLGYMWAPILANFFNIIFVIFGFYGAYHFRPRYIVAYLIWNFIWIGWNSFLICFYLDVGMLDKNSDMLNLGTGSVSWFEVNGYGCKPTYPTNITSDDPYRPVRPERVDDCILDYPIVEIIHSGVQCILAIFAVIGSTLLGYIFLDDDDRLKNGSKKAKHRQSLYSIEFGPSIDTIRSRSENIFDYDDPIDDRNGQMSPKPMTPRRVKRRSVMTRGTNSRQSTASRRSHHNNTGTNNRNSTRSSRRKHHQNPVTKLMDQQQVKPFASFQHKENPSLTASNLQSLNNEIIAKSTTKFNNFTKNISPDPIYYNTTGSTTQLQQSWDAGSPTGHFNPTYQHSTPNLANENEHVDELYNNRPPSVRSSYSNFHGTRPLSSYNPPPAENVFAGLTFHQQQQQQYQHQHNHTQRLPPPPVQDTDFPPPLPPPVSTAAVSQPQNIPISRRTVSRESIRSMAFLNSGPPAYNLNYHTPPDSETTM